jgi:single-strand DNA-binding protein
MAGSLNKAMIIGNVGRDPEIRSTQSGSRIANLSIATSESWKDKNSGERKERTEWHRVVVFNDKLVEVIEKYVVKGSKLYVEGAIQTRKWTDQSGAEKFSTEIVLQAFNGTLTLLGDPRSGGGEGGSRDSGQPQRRAPGPDLDDEIPF